MKKRIICTISILVLVAALCSGCSGNPFKITDSFASYYAENKEEAGSDLEGMAADLAVVSDSEATDPNYQSNDYADLLINDSANEIVESYHCFDKLYPASITKVMTALVAIKYGNLEDQVKVTDEAVITESGATLCGIKPGDTLTLEQLLYGLMLPSGNDAGAAIAVHMDGSIEAFADRMNEEAKRLGAVDSHFVNPHGLHDEDHYTTAYDLYLIFNEAFKYPQFREIIEAKAYTADYINGAGESVSRTWKCSNQFITGERDTPEGVTVLGGKTGTTKAAGYCLIIASKDDASEGNFISVVLKSDSRAHLYDNMTNIISKIVK